jgi:hypothetical protein
MRKVQDKEGGLKWCQELRWRPQSESDVGRLVKAREIYIAVARKVGTGGYESGIEAVKL